MITVLRFVSCWRAETSKDVLVTGTIIVQESYIVTNEGILLVGGAFFDVAVDAIL